MATAKLSENFWLTGRNVRARYLARGGAPNDKPCPCMSFRPRPSRSRADVGRSSYS